MRKTKIQTKEIEYHGNLNKNNQINRENRDHGMAELHILMGAEVLIVMVTESTVMGD